MKTSKRVVVVKKAFFLVVTDYWFVFLQLIMINFIEKKWYRLWGLKNADKSFMLSVDL